MGFFNIVFTAANVIVSHKKKNDKWIYEELQHTPYLYSSEYLQQLYKQSNDLDSKLAIYDHLQRHDALSCEGYEDITNQIWRDMYDR